ncbi:MAG: monovalent cation/H(+) antiporter subunit G [Lachnospiraceae bacterium]|jgi:multicomponent Na+:H+ antiporter subunit G|nr:monovalent cation/H(+) antiporter subunit G [Lachnospiraceae bacterium]
MGFIEWVRFIVGVGLLIAGLLIFVVELYGVFKFKYVLNRMHTAAMGDTMGLGISLLGLIVLCGLNFTSLKMGLIIVFLWLASPVSSHLIARLEVTINEELEAYCELPEERAAKETTDAEEKCIKEVEKEGVGC